VVATPPPRYFRALVFFWLLASGSHRFKALDEDGEYVSLTDKEAGGWTESWKQRLDKVL